eukprot:106987-Chlamydomonas_euryale.AAC.1
MEDSTGGPSREASPPYCSASWTQRRASAGLLRSRHTCVMRACDKQPSILGCCLCQPCVCGSYGRRWMRSSPKDGGEAFRCAMASCSATSPTGAACRAIARPQWAN